MKYLLLPVHLLKFWYLEALIFFLRTWKNLILFLEEDLAVSLMWKLLFVPLFHDTSVVGRILSFIFRIIRILLGVFGFSLATIFILSLALGWFLLPFAVILGKLGLLGALALFIGVGFFVIHILTHPHRAIWEVKDPKDLWQASWLKRKNISLSKLLQNFEVQNLLSILEKSAGLFAQIQIGDTEIIGKKAFELAKKTGSKYIGPNQFFVAVLKNSPDIDNFLLSAGLTIEDFEEALLFQEKRKNHWRKVWLWDSDFEIRHLKGINRGWLGVPTPQLDKVSTDLTKEAFKDVGKFYGRKDIILEVVNILSQEGKRNVLIVGLPGSGKSALITHLASLIIKGDAPAALATKRLVLLDIPRFLSGINNQGELADRVKSIFDEIKFSQNIILVIEEIHNLGLGEVGQSLNLYSLIAPFLESDNFQFIGTTEPENYSKVLEKSSSLIRLFTKVELPPASLQETKEILENLAILIERQKKIKVSYLAIKKATQLAEDLIHDRVLPDSAIEVLQQAQVKQAGWINSSLIEEVVAQRVKVPLALGNSGKNKLLNLEQEIHQKLIDQEDAVKAVSNSLRRSATGLKQKQKPIGSFLFVGPTGVGKTQLAKILAETYFTTMDSFIRFDMSEYQTPDAVDRLIGVNGEGGTLTEAVRAKQFALLLLDEFEKANPNILNLFLQVLDDGRLTDGAGRTIDFSNTIIIATSNGASLIIAKGLDEGKTLEYLDKKVNDELLRVFKPELINRFDDVILFKPLSPSDLQKIVRLKLFDLQAQIKKQGYLIEFDDVLVNELAKKGFNPVLGARPLQRLIQDTLESNLSKMILEGKLQKGKSFKIGPGLL